MGPPDLWARIPGSAIPVRWQGRIPGRCRVRIPAARRGRISPTTVIRSIGSMSRPSFIRMTGPTGVGGIGMALPPLFLAPAYYYTEWAALGLEAPPPGFQWVRYGPDLLLVNVTTGQVVDTVYDAFY